jgi:hypothetical protein
MIQMNFHGHGMYLIVLIKFFHCALKCYFILKSVRCFWRTLYKALAGLHERDLILELFFTMQGILCNQFISDGTVVNKERQKEMLVHLKAV